MNEESDEKGKRIAQMEAHLAIRRHIIDLRDRELAELTALNTEMEKHKRDDAALAMLNTEQGERIAELETTEKQLRHLVQDIELKWNQRGKRIAELEVENLLLKLANDTEAILSVNCWPGKYVKEIVSIVADWMTLQEEHSSGTMMIDTEEWERNQRLLIAIVRDYFSVEPE